MWQGAPAWETFARRAMRVRMVAVYFLALAVWGIAGRLSSGMPAMEILLSTLRLTAMAAGAICLLELFAWLVGRTTLYTITTTTGGDAVRHRVADHASRFRFG